MLEIFASALAVLAAHDGETVTGFKPAVRLQADGTLIDTEIGHAAPFVGDFDGDGVHDLLVGQFGSGILWVFRNEGDDANPRLAKGVKFKNGGAEGTVPTG